MIRCGRDNSTHPPSVVWQWAGGQAGKPICRGTVVMLDLLDLRVKGALRGWGGVGGEGRERERERG